MKTPKKLKRFAPTADILDPDFLVFMEYKKAEQLLFFSLFDRKHLFC